MREIKYQIFYKPDGEMKSVISVEPKDKWVTFWDNGEIKHCFYSFDGSSGNAILMEYTGVTDVEDSEIYEGDVVKMTCQLIATQDLDIIGEVKMLEGRWVVDSGSKANALWNEVCNTQILGSVHYNPDLRRRFK